MSPLPTPSTSPLSPHPPRCYVNMVYPPAYTQILTVLTGQTFQDGSDRQPIYPGLCQLLTLPLAGPFWIMNNLFWKTPACILYLEMVPQQFLEMKAEQYNPDTLYCYDVDLQTLSPHHISTECSIFRKMQSEKKGGKSPDNNLEGCNPQNYSPFFKLWLIHSLAAVSQTFLMKVVLTNSNAI